MVGDVRGVTLGKRLTAAARDTLNNRNERIQIASSSPAGAIPLGPFKNAHCETQSQQQLSIER
jgi:hypothetical protein